MSEFLQPPNDAVMWLRRGLRAVQAGDRMQARRCFEAARDANPDEIVALLWLAWLASSREESLALLSRVLELDPTNERARAGIRWARRLPSMSEAQPATASDREVVETDRAEGSEAAPLRVIATQAPPVPVEETTPEEATQGVPPQTAANKWQRFRITLEATAVVVLIGLIVAVWARQPLSQREETSTPVAPAPTATYSANNTSQASGPPSAIPSHTPSPTATPTATRVVKRTVSVTLTTVATRRDQVSSPPPVVAGTPKPALGSSVAPSPTHGLHPPVTPTLTSIAPTTITRPGTSRTPAVIQLEPRGIITNSLSPATPTPDIMVE